MTETPIEHVTETAHLAHELSERVKELHCLYRVSEILDDPRTSVDEKLNAVASALPAGLQHPLMAACEIRIDNRSFRSAGWKAPCHRQVDQICAADEAVGEIELIYTDTPPGEATQVFAREEEMLLREVARRVAEFLRSEWGRQRVDVLERRLQPSGAQKPSGSTTPRSAHGLIGDCPAMRRVYSAIAKASQTDATVLIQGESGTGKELVARAIHYGSNRNSASFVAVNCAAIPDQLVESELFGHVKGAFTGATTTRAGFFQTAEGGTIFLDEIGEMNATVQAKLLRVLQDREVRMVGSDRTRPTDVRILAATNQDLAALVESGRFRTDLFFRLHVLTIELPPLRERGDDLRLLLSHFVGRWTPANEGEPLVFSDRALRAMERYDWPGNVRELDNLVQRLSVMTDDRYVDIDDLPRAMHFASRSSKGSLRSLVDVEADHIRRVLDAVDGNRSRAAKILGIDRKTLRKKLGPESNAD